MPETAEQQARDMLERMGWEKAQELSAGDVVELANLIVVASWIRDTGYTLVAAERYLNMVFVDEAKFFAMRGLARASLEEESE